MTIQKVIDTFRTHLIVGCKWNMMEGVLYILMLMLPGYSLLGILCMCLFVS